MVAVLQNNSDLKKSPRRNLRQRFVELVRRDIMKKSNRWLKSVTDAKKKFYTEILDSF